MELYVFVSDERLNIRVNAALLAEAKEMGFRAGADLWTWFLDIGKVLGTMRQSCGPCHPWGQTLVKCLHTDELEAAARLKNIAKTSYRVADVYSARLGSQTKRRRMSARVAAETSRALLIATDKARQASRQRAQIIHRASYGDACEIFWLATAGHDRAYCLRE